MKLKCNHDRRVMVLASGSTIHRNDGSQCHGDGQIPVRPPLTIGGKKVTKVFTMHSETGNIPVGTCFLATDGDNDPKAEEENSSGEKLLKAIFEKPVTAKDIQDLIGNPLKGLG